jgi:hypothetical protein
MHTLGPPTGATCVCLWALWRGAGRKGGCGRGAHSLSPTARSLLHTFGIILYSRSVVQRRRFSVSVHGATAWPVESGTWVCFVVSSRCPASNEALKTRRTKGKNPREKNMFRSCSLVLATVHLLLGTVTLGLPLSSSSALWVTKDPAPGHQAPGPPRLNLTELCRLNGALLHEPPLLLGGGGGRDALRMSVVHPVFDPDHGLVAGITYQGEYFRSFSIKL